MTPAEREKAREVAGQLCDCDFLSGFSLCVLCEEKTECQHITVIASALAAARAQGLEDAATAIENTLINKAVRAKAEAIVIAADPDGTCWIAVSDRLQRGIAIALAAARAQGWRAGVEAARQWAGRTDWRMAESIRRNLKQPQEPGNG